MSLLLPKPVKPVKAAVARPKRKSRPRKKRKSSLAAAKRKLWDLFRAFVKARDGNVCFSCGKEGLEGSGWHAGHLFPAGGSAVLRWHALNVHSQCYRCNINLGGNGAEYASRFIEVYGIDQLMYLNEIKRQQMQWREPDIHALIAAMERGGADYELLYAELIGHVLIGAHATSYSNVDAVSSVDRAQGCVVDTSTTCENEPSLALEKFAKRCKTKKGDL